MLNAITLLLVFQLAGEVIARGLALPLPGPVLGMAMLFITLVIRGGPAKPLRDTAHDLLGHLSLLFVPAGAGIMLHTDRLAGEWQALMVALVVSTLAALAVSALVLSALLRRRGKRS